MASPLAWTCLKRAGLERGTVPGTCGHLPLMSFPAGRRDGWTRTLINERLVAAFLLSLHPVAWQQDLCYSLPSQEGFGYRAERFEMRAFTQAHNYTCVRAPKPNTSLHPQTVFSIFSVCSFLILSQISLYKTSLLSICCLGNFTIICWLSFSVHDSDM